MIINKEVIKMPGGNGKGPLWGNGPGTGRGRNRRFARGMGRGTGQGMVQRQLSESWTPSTVQPQSLQDPQQPIPEDQELDMLKQQAQTLQHHIDSILNRIDELSISKGKQNITGEKASVKAFIDENKCTGCGTCIDVCDQGAITLNYTAKIDSEKCSGCGVCVNTCPNEALALKRLDYQYNDSN